MSDSSPHSVRDLVGVVRSWAFQTPPSHRPAEVDAALTGIEEQLQAAQLEIEVLKAGDMTATSAQWEGAFKAEKKRANRLQEQLAIAERERDEATEAHRLINLGWNDAMEAKRRLQEQLEVARTDAARAIYLAQHLHQMIPQEVWAREHGAEWMGQYEGDYHAEKVRDELIATAALYPVKESEPKGD